MEKNYLTPLEVQSLISADLPGGQLETARDIFIFCCFTGLSYADVKSLQRTNVENGQWINIKHVKTGIHNRIPVLSIPQTIYRKYLRKSRDKFVFPLNSIRRDKMNVHLKQAGVACGIKKNLTFHFAGETFTHMALTSGLSFETVNKITGYRDFYIPKRTMLVRDEDIFKEFSPFIEHVKEFENQYFNS
jgi:site-specific recombinase XerD